MPSLTPITVIGDNLGIRHKYFNSLVKDAYENEDWTAIQRLPEKTPIDRLFKIELASKHRDVNYILENLKDEDMLYVSRALKSKWLLENTYQDILSPVNLENNIFPYMVTTAVTKTKHWIHLNLTDDRRLEEFYSHYCEKEFKLALKFLVKSSKEVIVNEFPKIMYKVSPREFKLLCECSPQVAKLFFDSLLTDEKLKSKYFEHQKQYFEGMKSVLKMDPGIFLDIVEKYFCVETFEKFSPTATKFVIQKHRDRFFAKPELYAAWLLDMRTLAANLNAERAKDLVEKLARAKYLTSWFSYKNVEPLIKRLKLEERAAFKKKIFVEKNFGKEIEKCPFALPMPPLSTNIGPSIYDDLEHEPSEYYNLEEMDFRCMLKKRKYAKWVNSASSNPTKTMLNKLFNEFRFAGFDKTLFELKRRIKAEGSKENRQYMMLVLVSKTGGRVDALASLVEVLLTHCNEPSSLRATILRSLVKKSFIWRLPEETWKKILDFAHDLGLDGKQTEYDCVEGMHAVILRHLLLNITPATELLEKYLKNFTTFSKFSLSIEEKIMISNALPKLLLHTSCFEKNMSAALTHVEKLLDTLEAYKISANTYSGLVTQIKYLAERDLNSTTPLLKRVYNAKIARKQFFKINFDLFKSHDSYLNALRHEANILKTDITLTNHILTKNIRSDTFFKKSAVYFNEENGVGQHILKALKLQIPNKNIARPIALLINGDIDSLDTLVESNKSLFEDQFIGAVKANYHLIRPFQKLDTLDWTSASAKFIANKVMSCKKIDIEIYVKELLKNKRALGIALALAKRSGNLADVVTTVASVRPTKAIKAGMCCIRNKDQFDLKIWRIIKPLLEKLDLTKTYLRKSLTNLDAIPLQIKAEYTKVIYEIFKKYSYYEALPYLVHIENTLHNFDQDFIEKLLLEWLNEYFVPGNIKDNLNTLKIIKIHIRLLVKHLLLSETEEFLIKQLKTIGELFFDRMNSILHSFEGENKYEYLRTLFFEILEESLLTLKCTRIFIDTRYKSCLTVMQRFEGWMKTILPIEKYFDEYCKLRLTMMYYKAIKQSLYDAPIIFNDKEKKFNEGIKLLGYNFGKYISHDLNELCSKYFKSIVDLYKDSLLSYLNVYFCTVDEMFIGSIIDGIFDSGVNSAKILGIYMLESKKYSSYEVPIHQITRSLEESKVKEEVTMFYNTLLYF